ncbi:MAG: TrkA family potassium uptake protein [Anaerolineaceae bacterium]|nr:TrkA family potassium uptake protein [Anaerolineaceae bacterium]
MYVIIVGGGQVGATLASLLINEGDHIRIIDNRKSRIAELQELIPAEYLILGSGSDPQILESAGIHEADVLAAITGSDETNLVICSLARDEFNVPRIISRVNNVKNKWLFTPQMGIDIALDQSEILAHLIAEEMSMGDLITLLKIGKGRYSLVEEKVDPESVASGKAIGDLEIPKQALITAIIRQGELITPDETTVLNPGDEIVAVVHSEEKQRLATLFDRKML